MYVQMTELERDKLAIIDEKAEIATEVCVRIQSFLWKSLLPVGNSSPKMATDKTRQDI